MRKFNKTENCFTFFNFGTKCVTKFIFNATYKGII